VPGERHDGLVRAGAEPVTHVDGRRVEGVGGGRRAERDDVAAGSQAELLGRDRRRRRGQRVELAQELQRSAYTATVSCNLLITGSGPPGGRAPLPDLGPIAVWDLGRVVSAHGSIHTAASSDRITKP